MSGSATLLVARGGATIDASNLVSKITWAGRRSSPARSLQVDFIDSDDHGHERLRIDVENGHHCIFNWQGRELFRGMFLRQTPSSSRTLSLRAYDNGFRLLRNKDTFNYSGVTASGVFRDACSRFGLPMGSVANTGFMIPELPKPQTTAWDAIADALGLTYQATGVRYFVMCRGERLNLIERRQNVLQWVLEVESNLMDYRYSKSIENIMTRIRLLSSEGHVVAGAINPSLERNIGIFQEVQTIRDEMNPGQLFQLLRGIINENGRPQENLTLPALGIPDVISGVGVMVSIRPLGISRTFYVEQDTHTFEGSLHTMNLGMCEAMDIMRSPR